MIAVQGLGYVTAHNWAYIAPFGAAACLSLLAWSRFQSRNSFSTRSLAAEHGLTGNPAEAAANFGSGCMAWPGNAPPWRRKVLLERTRTICIGYGLTAGVG